MVALADQAYRYGIEPVEGLPDFRILSSLRLVRSALEKTPLQIGLPRNGCNVDGAIYSLESDAIEKIGKLDLKKLGQLSDQLRSKYNMSSRIERDKLSQADRQSWDDVARTIAVPTERARGFLLDLESSRAVLHASDVIYSNDSADAVAGGGKLDALGISIKRRVEANEFDEVTVTSIGLWRLLNETDVLR